MALQVWLPLNGNLNNQGLADDLILTSGIAMYKVGKIGQGLDLNSRISFNCQTLSGLTKFSVAFWAKVEDNTSLTTNWQDIIGFTDQKADNSATGQIRAETCYNFSSLYTGVHWHDNVTYAIEMDDFSNHYSGDRGIWHHCVLAVDSNVGCSVYTDGNLIKTTNNPQGGHITGVFWLGETNNIAGCINDVRIYDHVLSPREVAEIAKGLVLHYPLSMPGQENLVLDSYGLSTTASKTNINCSKRGASTRRLNDYGFYEGQVTASYGGVSFYANQLNLQVGDVLTYSFYVYTNGSAKSFSFYPMMFLPSGTRDVTTGIQTSLDGGSYTTVNDKSFGTISSTTPERHYVTFIWNQNVKDIIDSGGSIELSIQIHGDWQAGDYGSVFAPKLEKGEIATPWLPNPADPEYAALGLNNNVVYDTSGYGNNGTVNGTLVVLSDSPRYNTFTQIDGSTITCASGLISVADPVFSVSLWFRLKSNTSYTIYQDLINFASPSYSNQPFRLEICGSPVGNDINWFRGPTGSTGGFKVNNTALSRDVWYHTVLVSEGNKQYSYYMNGVKQGTYNGSANTWTPTGSVTIGDSIAGKIDISDFRIYATALTEDQVKQLYEAPISLANNGTLFANEFNET